MSHVLTFVASDARRPLAKSHIAEAVKIMRFYDTISASAPTWLAKNKAADLEISAAPGGVLLHHLRDMLNEDKIDLFTLPVNGRRKKLLLADMDSTIVTAETLDELAAYAGLKDKIAAITALAMEGKLDFEAALRERVGLLTGLEISALEETLKLTEFSPGAKTLVATMKAHGAACVLVSGGFTFFTGPVANEAGFDHHHGNTLGVDNGRLTGTVAPPILDKFAKLVFLEEYCKKHNLKFEDAMTVGDGANDIPMLKKAGLGVGYRPKQVVEDAVTNFIRHGDLSAALYAQGYAESDILVNK